MLADRYDNPVIVYKTSEQKTGEKWIDGKDIYVKSFQMSRIENGKKTYSHGISNLGRLIKDEFLYHDSAEGRFHYGNTFYPDGNYVMTAGADLGLFHIESSTAADGVSAPDWPSRTDSVFYTMYYTKA